MRSRENAVMMLARVRRAMALTLCTMAMLAAAQPAGAGLLPYETGQWHSLLASGQGKPLLVHFWGFSCPPCIEELPAWADFVRAHPGLNAVFIEVDQVPEEMTRRALTDERLIDADNRANVAYFDEYFRYEIDPQWFGELPITLLIDAKGKVRKLRGTADFAAIDRWAAGKNR